MNKNIEKLYCNYRVDKCEKSFQKFVVTSLIIFKQDCISIGHWEISSNIWKRVDEWEKLSRKSFAIVYLCEQTLLLSQSVFSTRSVWQCRITGNDRFLKSLFHKSRVVNEYPVNEELKKKKKFNCTNQEIRSTGVKELKKLKVFVL